MTMTDNAIVNPTTQTDKTQIDKEEAALPPPLRADSTLVKAVAAFDEYMVRKGFSDNTIKAFRNDLKIVQDFLGRETRLHQVNTQHLYDFLEWLQHERGKPCSAKSLARRITTIKVFFGWIHGIGVIGTDPAEPVIQQPARTPLPIILRDSEISQLVRTAQDYLWDRNKPDARPYLLINLLLQTGMKKAECARLLVNDVDLARTDIIELTVRYPDERHAHKNRTMALDPNLATVFQQYLTEYKPQNFLFECTPRNLEYVLDEVGRKAEIHHTQVGFETLRWTCAVRDFRRGMPEDRLRQKMGLSKISWRETREKILKLTGQG
ncbi:MAG: site-specific integrase [Caldilinea sp. CFX5]|nr:site-specific integrase [Caldilinea sp. CFX5]